jgi:hypothetical protein
LRPATVGLGGRRREAAEIVDEQIAREVLAPKGGGG